MHTSCDCNRFLVVRVSAWKGSHLQQKLRDSSPRLLVYIPSKEVNSWRQNPTSPFATPKYCSPSVWNIDRGNYTYARKFLKRQIMRYFPHRSYFLCFLGPHDSFPQQSYVANRLPARKFLRCQRRWKAPGSTRLGTQNCGNANIHKSGFQNGTQWLPFHCISYETFG